jgi:hypothetical protein
MIKLNKNIENFNNNNNEKLNILIFRNKEKPELLFNHQNIPVTSILNDEIILNNVTDENFNEIKLNDNIIIKYFEEIYQFFVEDKVIGFIIINILIIGFY